MKISTRRLLVAGTATAIALGGLTAASAAPNAIEVRASDIDQSTVSTNVDGARFEFLKEGIRVDYTDPQGEGADGNNKFVRAIFDTDTPLSEVTSIAYDWTGTGYGTQSDEAGQAEGPTAPIATRYNVDTDSNGVWDCQLVGETIYGDTLVWLNRQNASGGAAADSCTTAAPRPEEGSTTGHPEGSLAEWSTALGSTANVVQAGFVASDRVARGVLRSISLGEDVYTFTGQDAALPPSDVTATSEITVTGTKVRVKVTGDAVPSGKSEGEPALVEIKQGARTATTLTQRSKVNLNAGETTVWTTYLPAGTPKQKIQVFVDGVKIDGVQAP